VVQREKRGNISKGAAAGFVLDEVLVRALLGDAYTEAADEQIRVKAGGAL
jgi:hypothetical protein